MGKNDRTNWRPVRLRRETVARLDAYRAAVMVQAERGADVPTEGGGPGGGPVSYDTLVGLLLDQLDAHRARARRQRERLSQASAAARQEVYRVIGQTNL